MACTNHQQIFERLNPHRRRRARANELLPRRDRYTEAVAIA